MHQRHPSHLKPIHQEHIFLPHASYLIETLKRSPLEHLTYVCIFLPLRREKIKSSSSTRVTCGFGNDIPQGRVNKGKTSVSLRLLPLYCVAACLLTFPRPAVPCFLFLERREIQGKGKERRIRGRSSKGVVGGVRK